MLEQCSWRAWGQAGSVADHLAQVFRAPLQLSHSSGDLPGCVFNPVTHAVEKAPGQEVFWLQEIYPSCAFFSSVRKAWAKPGHSQGCPMETPSKKPFQKELECQELSLSGVLMLLYSENNFLPRWRIGLPKHKLPSKEITAFRLIRSSFVCSVLGWCVR